MTKLRTAPNLQRHLLDCVRKYVEGNSLHDVNTNNSEIRDVNTHQTQEGWKNFIKGIWSDKWEKIQDLYYRENQPDDEKNKDKFNVSVWNKRMVKIFFHITINIWNERCQIVLVSTILQTQC